jgi:hypothetical protein
MLFVTRHGSLHATTGEDPIAVFLNFFTDGKAENLLIGSLQCGVI